MKVCCSPNEVSRNGLAIPQVSTTCLQEWLPSNYEWSKVTQTYSTLEFGKNTETLREIYFCKCLLLAGSISIEW